MFFSDLLHGCSGLVYTNNIVIVATMLPETILLGYSELEDEINSSTARNVVSTLKPVLFRKCVIMGAALDC